ncbi:hypothetical protein [Streptomyces sp. NPDC005732]|uniref:hypothetical protein n=1 Tax=Streptomyces sp. NPDC005732 TaxID=3157057 RepID=UPI0033DA2001
MSTTDGYGQGISLASLTDAPDIPKAISDLAAGVIPRTAMRFASATTRGATITSPVAGMLAWLNDVGLLTVYDGSTWVVVASGVRAWTTVALASGWSQNGNSQGSLQYRIVNLFGEDTIMLRGGISRASYPGSMPDHFTINNTLLPAAARPGTLRTIVVPCSDVGSDRIALKLDIATTGELNLFGTSNTAKPAWVGFNGCFASL